MPVTASIVAFHNSPDMIRAAIDSALNAPNPGPLFLVDNSEDAELAKLCERDLATYHHTGRNLGYGRAHNVGIRRAIEMRAPYHMILNPDVYFAPDVPETLRAYMDANPDVGMVMPQIRSPDESLQQLCKRDPGPFDLAGRRFLPRPLKRLFRRRFQAYEMRELGQTRDTCQRRSKISPPGRSKTSPLNVMRYAVLGGCPGSP